MPDRILARGVVLRTLGWIVIGIMLVAGVTATVFAYNNAQSAHNGAAAVAALKKSSARSECRTRIVNEDDDAFRHRIGALQVIVGLLVGSVAVGIDVAQKAVRNIGQNDNTPVS
jgi:hypothetical protein